MLPSPRGFLHDHIDGSMAVHDTIEEMYKVAGKPFPFRNLHMFLAHVRDTSLPIWKRFKPITGILQTAESLEMLGHAYGRRRWQEGLTYVEGKFAPQYSTDEGLTIQTATDAMIRGLRAAEKEYGITIFPHVCIGREAEPDTGIEVAKAALKYDGEIALDLACTETGNPPEKHLEAFKLTFGSRVKRECHAGEDEDRSQGDLEYWLRLMRNMLTAVLELKCHGISHCIPLPDYPDFVEYLVDREIRVAGCPLSNVAEGHIDDVSELSINDLLQAGLSYTLNPDDDLILPPMKEVLHVCNNAYDFTPEQALALEENVFRGAFDDRVRV